MSAFVIVVLVGVTGMILALGSAVSARHEAQSVADLAALGGAYHSVEGEDVACGASSELVHRSQATLVSCHVVDLDVIVEVSVHRLGGGKLVGPAHARSRAGPAENGEKKGLEGERNNCGA